MVINAPLLALALALLAAPPAQADSRLTAIETEWLRAAAPALSHAVALGLPLKIIVQPISAAGLSPFSMGFHEGVCRFVVSLRENPQADAALMGATPALRPIFIEAMAFHEIAHCWRHARGLWGSSPSPSGSALPESQRDLSEEAFADLAALAWIRDTRPDQSAAVQSWIESVRAESSLSREAHSTLPWVHMARSGFAGFAGHSPMQKASSAWAFKSR